MKKFFQLTYERYSAPYLSKKDKFMLAIAIYRTYFICFINGSQKERNFFNRQRVLRKYFLDAQRDGAEYRSFVSIVEKCLNSISFNFKQLTRK